MVRTVVRLIRHEQTQANIEKRYIGWTDQPIVEIVRVTVPIKPAVIYGSDLLRCRQTASCYFPHVPFVKDVRLRELHFGDFEMKTYKDLQHDLLYRAWIDNPLYVTPPNGEAFLAFQSRVQAAFREITDNCNEAVFVVHGGVIKLILAMCFGKGFHEVHATHRTVYTISWEEGETCMSLSEEPIMVKGNTSLNS